MKWLLAVSAALLLALLLMFSVGLAPLLERALPAVFEGRGVSQLRIADAQLQPGQLVLLGVRATGVIEGAAFEFSLAQATVRFDWHGLRAQRLQSLELDAPRLLLEPSDRQTVADDSTALMLVPPSQLLTAVPVDRLAVRDALVELAFQDREPLQVEWHAALSDSLALTASTTWQGQVLAGHLQAEPDQPFGVVLSLVEQGRGTEASARFGAELDIAKTGQWRWSLDGTADLAALARLITHLREALPELGAFPVVSAGTLALEGALSHPAHIPPAPMWFGDQSVDWSLQLEIKTDLQAVALQDGLRVQGTPLDILVQASGESAQLRLGPGDWLLQIAADSRYLENLGPLWRQPGAALPVRVTWPRPIVLSSSDLQQWVFTGSGLALLAGEGRTHLRYEADQLRLSVDAAGPPEHTVLAGLLSGAVGGHTLPQLRLVAGQQRQDGAALPLAYQWVLTDLAESLTLSAEGALTPATGAGVLRYSLRSLDLAYASQWLLALAGKFDEAARDAVVSGGTATLSGAITHAGFELADAEHRASLLLADISGAWRDYPFEGLGVSSRLRGIQHLRSEGPVDLNVARVNVGFDVFAMQAGLSVAEVASGLVIEAETFSAEMFGGRTWLPNPHRWELWRTNNELLLRVEDWRLSELVALQNGQSIEATGALSGELPVAWDGGRLLIDAGYLRSVDPGGLIRYRPDMATRALARDNKELTLALDLLEEFEFDLLRSDVLLDRDGSLLLGLSLAGRSPQNFGGRQVEFNINVEQNLDPLLRSLRLSDRVMQDLADRLQ